MPDPVLILCPTNVWTVVATNVTTGLVHILDDRPDGYLQTYRDTGNAAPTTNTEGVKFEDSLQISAASAVDVYVWCIGTAGNVRVDL